MPSMNLPHSPPIAIDKFWTQPRDEAGDPWLRLSNKCSCLHSNLDLEIVRTNIPEFVSAFRNAHVGHRGGRELTIANLFMEAPADMWRHLVTCGSIPKRSFKLYHTV